MVGISGLRDRQIKLVKKDNYDVVVFSWPNWENYFDKYVNMEFIDKDANKIVLKPELQWQWKQNYPELVVEDVVHNWQMDRLWNEFDTYDDVRDFVYGDLLYRGVNKWLFVRYMLVRYKKVMANRRDDFWKEYEKQKDIVTLMYPMRHRTVDDWGRANYWLGYYKGMHDAYAKVRAELKTLASSPRYVVWNGSRPGFIVDKNIHKGWLDLIRSLYDIRFEK